MNRVIFSGAAFAIFAVLIAKQVISGGAEENAKEIPGLKYQRNPDGSVSGSFGFSHALSNPHATGAFGVSQTFSFGPKGSSFGGSHSASLNGAGPGGHNFGFSQSNTHAHSAGENGFSSSGGNSASSHHANPLFSASQANANAFANQVNYNKNLNQFQQPQPFIPPTGPRGRNPSRRLNRFRHHPFF